MQRERIALFLDGWNFNRTVRDCFGSDITIDYKKLLELFSKDAYLVAAYYYTGDTGAEAQLQFLTWLKRNGFRLVTRVARIYDNGESEPKIKANLDVEIAVDIMTLAPRVDRVILFSGDGDFTRLLKRVGSMGVRTHVVSHWQNSGSCLSPDLLEAADQFTDIAEFINDVKLEERNGHNEINT